MRHQEPPGIFWVALINLLVFSPLQGLNHKPDNKGFIPHMKIPETSKCLDLSSEGSPSKFLHFVEKEMSDEAPVVMKDCINSNHMDHINVTFRSVDPRMWCVSR
jgi:hypothetical protein